MKHILLMLALLIGFAEKSSAEVSEAWRDFQENSREFMARNPEKRDALGNVLPPQSYFGERDVSSKEYVNKKARARGQARFCNEKGVCLDEVRKGRARAQNSYLDLLDQKEFTNKGLSPLATLAQIDAQRLQAATLPEQPWSSSYWPIYQGSIAARYASVAFEDAGYEWNNYYDFISKRSPLASVYRSGDTEALADLSPAEKYDLLLGDLSEEGAQQGYLAKRMWSEGEGYNERYGSVESWMGLCHGWAPASFMVPRPLVKVAAVAADGQTQLRFYPDDVKALVTQLWATAQPTTSFVGGRCNDKDPKRDASGRILDEACFDVNPATFHLAMVNQIGLAKRSFVMDATYDYEVWNQPIYGYAYRYFNPETGERFVTAAEAQVARADFGNDKFATFRDRATKAMVGVEMDVTYVVEQLPTHDAGLKDEDVVQTVTYVYDLELNEAGEVTGGEWYSESHPDFLWLPLADAKARSPFDSALRDAGTWDAKTPLPNFWRDIGIASAVRLGLPLESILTPLVKASAVE